jgi:DNA-binding transcriptional ArsR family regulator
MSRGKSHSSMARDLPALVDLQLVRALDHILRQHMLLAAVQGEVSPKRLSKALGEGLSQVSYHMKVLRDDCELIERTRTVPRRGAVENYYRATEKTLLPAKTWRRLKKGLRAVVGARQASDLFNDLAEALKAGKLQGASDLIARTPLILDAEGKRKVKAIAERATREVEDEQQAASKRMEGTGGNGGKLCGYTFAVLAFEAAWEPADLQALVAGTEEGGTPSTDGASDSSHNGTARKRDRREAGVRRR